MPAATATAIALPSPSAAIRTFGTVGRPTHWRHAFLCAAALLTGCAQALPAGEVQRKDLPAFDAAKAKQVTPEKRAALEHELFSELSLWNRGSVKYPTAADITRREQRWQAMANDGFELAHLSLRVLQPSTGHIYELQQPMQRLTELAEQGDAGAMCLMSALSIQASERINIDAYRPVYRKWMEKGAELGHPECQLQLGGNLLLGSAGLKKDRKRGFSLSFAAIETGYTHDLGGLSLHFRSKGFESADNVKRLYCWKIIAAKTYPSDPLNSLRYLVEKQSPERLRALEPLLSELKSWDPEASDCIQLGTGEAP